MCHVIRMVTLNYLFQQQERAMRRLLIAVTGIVLQMWLTAFAIAETEQDIATKAYLEWCTAVQKATTISELLPYASNAFAATLKSRGMKNQTIWLEVLKEGVMKDLKITRASCAAAKCTLEATGTNVRDRAMIGKIKLVRENNLWKQDEELWTMKLPAGL
jgi:hypothetical protein